jgi:hypothetical protein
MRRKIWCDGWKRKYFELGWRSERGSCANIYSLSISPPYPSPPPPGPCPSLPPLAYHQERCGWLWLAAAATLLKCEQKGPCFSHRPLSIPFSPGPVKATVVSWIRLITSSGVITHVAAGVGGQQGAAASWCPACFTALPRVCFKHWPGTESSPPACSWPLPVIFLTCLCRSLRFEPWARGCGGGGRDRRRKSWVRAGSWAGLSLKAPPATLFFFPKVRLGCFLACAESALFLSSS